MDPDFDDRTPIWRQVRERVVAMVLDGLIAEGDPLPSVRTVATESRVNPLTVLKGYQQLGEEGLVEKRRGLGMFVTTGARARLKESERRRFIEEEWPAICAAIRRLELDPAELLAAINEENR